MAQNRTYMCIFVLQQKIMCIQELIYYEQLRKCNTAVKKGRKPFYVVGGCSTTNKTEKNG